MDKLLLAINMAVQLGITKIILIITEWCQFRTVNMERLQKCVIEATEQSERLNMPVIEPAILLADYLASNTQNLVIYANEQENEKNSIMQILLPFKNNSVDISIIIGPEGGFTDIELSNFASYSNTQSISLGTNILRAETAAVT